MKDTICRDCGTPRGAKDECRTCGGTDFVTCYSKRVGNGYDCDEKKCPVAVSPEVCDYAKAFARRAKDLADDLYTTREVADYLKVSVETVRDWIVAGKLAAVDLGGRTGYRVRNSDLDAFLAERTKKKEVSKMQETETKIFYVWGRGPTQNALIASGDTTRAAIDYVRQHGYLALDDPDEWVVEVEATEDEIDAATRYDSAVQGYAEAPDASDETLEDS